MKSVSLLLTLAGICITLQIQFDGCAASKVCDFDTDNCGWKPEPARNGFKLERSTSNKIGNYMNFMTDRMGGNEPIYLASEYYKFSGQQCRLNFAYRLAGVPGAKIEIVVDHKSWDSNRAGDLISVGTLNVHAQCIAGWETASIHIGHPEPPTVRLLIECHVDFTTEPECIDSTVGRKYYLHCAIDNITFSECSEEPFEDNPCKGANRHKYFECKTRTGPHCINFDQVCDMHVDCVNGEDEDPVLSNCSQKIRSGKKGLTRNLSDLERKLLTGKRRNSASGSSRALFMQIFLLVLVLLF